MALLTALAAILLVAGCGGDDNGGGGDEDYSVAFVTDTAGTNDRGFNEYSINGVEKAEQDLGITKRIYVSKSADDYIPNLTAAAEDGADLVIAAGFLIAPSVIEVAQEFPDTNFAGVDHFYGGEGCEKANTCEQPNALGLQHAPVS